MLHIYSDLLKELCVDDEEYKKAIDLIEHGGWTKEEIIDYLGMTPVLPPKKTEESE